MHLRNRSARHADAIFVVMTLAASIVASDGNAQDGGLADAGSAASSATSNGTWNKVANEWTTFTVSGTQRIRYGSGTRWIEASVSGTVPCKNDFFGYDPLPGVTKECDLWIGASTEPTPPADTTPVLADTVSPPALDAPRASARVFISGHSLTAEPIGSELVKIAQSLGASAKYNEQLATGSSIHYRVRGDSDTGWAGYSLGDNREGSNMNVIAELRNPQTLGGDRYDTLIIAERYDLLVAIDYDKTARYLRHVHERLIEGNPRSNSYFYESWFELDDKSDPRDWIAYERASSPVWQCVATRINQSLAAEGRSDRVVSLPAGSAMAELIERATQGGLAGVTGSSVLETVNRVISDNVHMTPLGKYYMALITYSAVYRSSPVGAWAPSEVTGTQANTLQRLAWEYVSSYYARRDPPRTLAQCQSLVQDSYCSTYWTFHGEAQRIASCRDKFSRQNDDNPFYFNAASDASYWFPAP